MISPNTAALSSLAGVHACSEGGGVHRWSYLVAICRDGVDGTRVIDSLFVCFLYIGDEKTNTLRKRRETNNGARNGGAGISTSNGSVRGLSWVCSSVAGGCKFVTYFWYQRRRRQQMRGAGSQEIRRLRLPSGNRVILGGL